MTLTEDESLLRICFISVVTISVLSVGVSFASRFSSARKCVRVWREKERVKSVDCVKLTMAISHTYCEVWQP